MISGYERVENILVDMTPDPCHFERVVYPLDDADNDLKQYDDFKHTPQYKKSEDHSDAKLLKKTFIDMMKRGDWFGEDEFYGDDLDYLCICRCVS